MAGEKQTHQAEKAFVRSLFLKKGGGREEKNRPLETEMVEENRNTERQTQREIQRDQEE